MSEHELKEIFSLKNSGVPFTKIFEGKPADKRAFQIARKGTATIKYKLTVPEEYYQTNLFTIGGQRAKKSGTLYGCEVVNNKTQLFFDGESKEDLNNNVEISLSKFPSGKVFTHPISCIEKRYRKNKLERYV